MLNAIGMVATAVTVGSIYNSSRVNICFGIVNRLPNRKSVRIDIDTRQSELAAFANPGAPEAHEPLPNAHVGALAVAGGRDCFIAEPEKQIRKHLQLVANLLINGAAGGN